MFWFRLNILCRVSGYRGHVVRQDLSCEIFRLGKRIPERCAVPIGVLIILGGWNPRPGAQFKPWVERQAPSRALPAGRGGRVRLAIPWEEESVRAFGRKVAGTPDFAFRSAPVLEPALRASAYRSPSASRLGAVRPWSARLPRGDPWRETQPYVEPTVLQGRASNPPASETAQGTVDTLFMAPAPR